MKGASHSQELVKYRLEQAAEKLGSAEILLGHGKFRDSASRAYYAMFAAARALLAARGLGAKTHSGVVGAVGEHYVKTGLLSRESARRLLQAKDLREESDYADFVEVSEADAKRQLDDARAFVEEARSVLGDIGEVK